MVKLFLYEYRKHFIKTSIIIAVLLFSLINIARIYSLYDSGIARKSSLLVEPHWRSLYWEMYDDFGGKITNEKIQKLMDIYQPLMKQTADHTASTSWDNKNTYTGNLYNDALFFGSCYVRPMEYFYMYKSYANSVTLAARENMSFFDLLKNTYEYKKNAEIVDIFNGRSISNFTYVEMYQYYLHYDFSVLLILLICLYGLLGVFISEKETEMDTLLLTTKCGGYKTILAKLLSSTVFVCGICLWFLLLDFITFSCIFGSIEGANAPLYALENFSNASINVNLGQYALLTGVIRMLGILLLGMFFLMITCLFKNALLPFLLNLPAAFGLIYVHEAFASSGYIVQKIINPFTLIINRGLFRQTEFINLFGFPMLSWMASLMCAVLWGVLLLISITALVKKSVIRKKKELKSSAIVQV